ncbi:uncharacterized protein LOC131952242 [Physella acuta]|uniref:uncharacterized protein LOC131952242 n=1 Tax=Physella acuta TaxID=109671 RepID=UPI0027DB0AEA|nr:uncharacterized protein LOC131952242 [Physella acuta]
MPKLNFRLKSPRVSSHYYVPLVYLHKAPIPNAQRRYIEAGAFLPLKNLIFLDLTHNEDIDIPYINDVLYGLNEITTLKFLRINLIVNRYSLGICLESSYFHNFPPNLEYLEAHENNIEAVDRQFIQKLPKTLKTLDLSGNRFVFGTYLADLSKMENLTVLMLSKAGFTYSIPNRYPYALMQSSKKKNCTLYDETSYEEETFEFTLPPILKRLEMNGANLNYVLSKLRVKDNQLEYLSITENRFPILIGPLQGFNYLKYFDISLSFVAHIEDGFFSNLSSLELTT